MSNPSETQAKRGPNWVAWAPLIIFVVLAGVFAAMLLQPGRNAATIPSVLIGKPAPQLTLPPLATVDIPAFEPAAFDGVTLVNFWASWCAPCRAEHPFLVAMGRDERLTIAGVNYKDKPDQAAGFLEDLGNPYDMIGTDANGRAGIEWGVYGMPETFLVDASGMIVFKHVGPITDAVMRDQLGPAIEAALAKQ